MSAPATEVTDQPGLPTPGLAGHWFRRAYGRLVALLCRRFPTESLETVEDAVQGAMVAAVSGWRHRVPPDPQAWLYRVAFNQLIDGHRSRTDRARAVEQHPLDLGERTTEPVTPSLNGEIDDDLLRMLFVCCPPDVPPASSLVLALKVLCGFNTAEMAHRLFTSEANIHKRLERAKARLSESGPALASAELSRLSDRVPTVRTMLYLLFNEGYHSLQSDRLVRRELCDEAIRLTSGLAHHSLGGDAETFALLALMYFHGARLESRTDGAGGLLLLEDQDRSKWDRGMIQAGFHWLGRSVGGDHFTKFHAEAMIAAEHCAAPSVAQTRWAAIVELYEMLERTDPSPLHTLNRAIALAQLRGPDAGLAALDGLVPPSWLVGFYLWDSVLGELHRRAGHSEVAVRHLNRALESAPTEQERALLRRRLALAQGR